MQFSIRCLKVLVKQHHLTMGPSSGRRAPNNIVPVFEEHRVDLFTGIQDMGAEKESYLLEICER